MPTTRLASKSLPHFEALSASIAFTRVEKIDLELSISKIVNLPRGWQGVYSIFQAFIPAFFHRYLYNITPWTQSVQTAARKGFRLFYSDDDDIESDNDERMAVTTAYGINLGRKKGTASTNLPFFGHFRDSVPDKSTPSGNSIQPYAHGHPDRERLALDISALKKQYAKLRERQRQAHIILTAACARQSKPRENPAEPS